MIQRLRPGQDPNNPQLDENGVPLPATATPRELMMWAGALMMLIALLWLLMNRERRLW